MVHQCVHMIILFGRSPSFTVHIHGTGPSVVSAGFNPHLCSIIITFDRNIGYQDSSLCQSASQTKGTRLDNCCQKVCENHAAFGTGTTFITIISEIVNTKKLHFSGT